MFPSSEEPEQERICFEAMLKALIGKEYRGEWL